MKNFIKNYSVELGINDIKQLITAAVEEETGRYVTSIEITIDAGYEDRFSFQPACFNKAVVKLGELIKNPKDPSYSVIGDQKS